jgi:hypothetical protein
VPFGTKLLHFMLHLVPFGTKLLHFMLHLVPFGTKLLHLVPFGTKFQSCWLWTWGSDRAPHLLDGNGAEGPVCRQKMWCDGPSRTDAASVHGRRLIDSSLEERRIDALGQNAAHFAPTSTKSEAVQQDSCSGAPNRFMKSCNSGMKSWKICYIYKIMPQTTITPQNSSP